MKWKMLGFEILTSAAIAGLLLGISIALDHLQRLGVPRR